MRKNQKKTLIDLFKRLEPVYVKKLEILIEVIEEKGKFALAFSGGLDSGVLLAISSLILPRENLLALTAISEIHPEDDRYWAVLLATTFRVRHLLVPFEPLRLKAFRQNPPDRCYYCKRTMYKHFLSIAQDEGFSLLADGTILEDFLEDRPGFRALRELEIIFPLTEAAFYKEHVKTLWRALGLSGLWRRRFPCWATRFLPGEPIREESLHLVKRAERFLETCGLCQFRLRIRAKEAFLELDPREETTFWLQRGKILTYLKQLGFKRVFFDLEGYRPPRER